MTPAQLAAEAAMSGCAHPWRAEMEPAATPIYPDVLGVHLTGRWECPHCLITSPTAYDALCPDLVLAALTAAVLAEREQNPVTRYLALCQKGDPSDVDALGDEGRRLWLTMTAAERAAIDAYTEQTLRVGVLAERERCARVAEDVISWERRPALVAHNLAVRIRNPPTEK